MTEKRFACEHDDYNLNLVDNEYNTFYTIDDFDENIRIFCKRLNKLVDENEQLKIQLESCRNQQIGQANKIHEILKENEQLKQSEKDCQELNHKLINENDELEQEIKKFKRIIDILEVERCEYLTDKQARSKWGDDYD